MIRPGVGVAHARSLMADILALAGHGRALCWEFFAGDFLVLVTLTLLRNLQLFIIEPYQLFYVNSNKI